ARSSSSSARPSSSATTSTASCPTRSSCFFSSACFRSAGAAAARIVIPEFTILPLAARFWPAPAAPAGVEQITGNLPYALLALLVVWTLAAFGEEFVYRGYLLLRAAEALGGGRAAQWVAMALAAVLFGIGHYYKGPAGMLDSGFAGLLLGAAYLLTGRNLWTAILAHGFIDTVGVALVYLGLDG
ncbi:MAG: CPBP family intramembrane metalloprotease, partial [Thermoanaerobaculia bacterium]